MTVDTLKTVQLLRRSINDTPGSAHIVTSSTLSLAAESEVGSNTSINSHETHCCCDPKKRCQKSFTASFEKKVAMRCICRC